MGLADWLRTVHRFAAENHRRDPSRVGDVVQWACIENHEIGAHARFQCTRLSHLNAIQATRTNSPLVRLGVDCATLEVDSNKGFIANEPCVVARRNRPYVASAELGL